MADAKGDSTKTAVLLDDFVTSLRRRKVEGSLDTAKRTALLMRQVIADARSPNPADLIAAVRAAGVRLAQACNTGASLRAAKRRTQPARPRLALCAPGGCQAMQHRNPEPTRCAVRSMLHRRLVVPLGHRVSRFVLTPARATPPRLPTQSCRSVTSCAACCTSSARKLPLPKRLAKTAAWSAQSPKLPTAAARACRRLPRC